MRGRAGSVVALIAVAALPHACVGDLPAIAGGPGSDAGDAADASFEDASGEPDRVDEPDVNDARPGACRFDPLLEAPGPEPGCTGFVLAKEDIATLADENCDGYTGNVVSGQRIGYGNKVSDVALATAPLGTVFLGGTYSGFFALGQGSVGENPGAVFLAAVLDGSALWSERWGNAVQDRLRGISVNPAGQVLAYAQFVSTVDLGNGALEPIDETTPQAAWGSYSLQGTPRWSRMPRGAGDGVTSKALTAVGHDAYALVYAADRPVTLAEGPTLPDGTSILVLNARTGRYVSHFALGPVPPPALVVGSLVADSCDNLYVAGKVTGRQKIAGVELGDQDSTSTFLVKLAPSDGGGFTYERSRLIAQGTDLTSTHVAALRDGTVVVASDIDRPTAFGGNCDPIDTYGQQGVMVARLDAELDCLFATAVGEGNPAVAYALTADAYGNTVVGATRLEDQGGLVVLTKLDAEGRTLWFRELSPGKVVLSALAIDSSGFLVAAGTFSESADFGQGPITVLPDLQGLFLTKYSP